MYDLNEAAHRVMEERNISRREQKLGSLGAVEGIEHHVRFCYNETAQMGKKGGWFT